MHPGVKRPLKGNRMDKKTAVGICLVFLFSSMGMLHGDDSDIGERYAVLETRRTGTMQNEIRAAAERGFRVLNGATIGEKMVIMMERLATPEDPYKYLLLAMTRTDTIEKELKEAGDAGYKLLPQTLVSKRIPFSFGMLETVVVLEKAPKSSRKYQYRLLENKRTSAMEKEILEAEEAGYTLVGICNRGEPAVVMEKTVE
jgi:hypothetical protein